jgi:hypothetical protein
VRPAGFAALILAGCFIAYLAYTTMAAAPDLPDAGGGAEAERVCEDGVRAQVAGARFPIAPSTTDVDGGRVRLEGVVDAGPEGATVRRNYECLVSAATRGGYQVDSVNVWQSH